MTALVDSLRGTLAGVVGVAEHLAWYVEWQAGGRRCARTAEREPHFAVTDSRSGEAPSRAVA